MNEVKRLSLAQSAVIESMGNHIGKLVDIYENTADPNIKVIDVGIAVMRMRDEFSTNMERLFKLASAIPDEDPLIDGATG